ncbi:MAG: TIGR01841 family phasin [Caulobacteraceae bacterium]|nr:TIGR01841 family phasin [Caulobacteraceae bacterium]
MQKGAEAIKNTAERFTAAGDQAFREGVEKSIAGLNEVNAASKRNLEAVVESVTAATKGAETLGANTLAFTKKSWEDATNAAQALTSAKSIQEVIEVQTAWAKGAMEAYLAEVTRATDIVSASVKDSFKPLNERATATVERFQSAR